MRNFLRMIRWGNPESRAIIKGSPEYPELHATVELYPLMGGSLIIVAAEGLPAGEPFIAMHLHSGDNCSGDDFSGAGGHLNFELLEHPLHTGDFPELLNNEGYAWSAFFTDRFTPRQAIGYPIVIHERGDDYCNQPSGNSGKRIGCGIVRR
jgi:Cu-Zn family superoxide dismutase